MSAKRHEFKPDWCIAPSETLREWLEENHMGRSVLAAACAGQHGRDDGLRLITEVMERKPLTESHARLLERGTGIPARFWLALEHNYRAGLAAGLTDASEPPCPSPPEHRP